MRAEVKTVVLYNLRRVRSETLQAIIKARDLELIGVEPEELDSFVPINFFMPDVDKAYREKTGQGRGRRHKEDQDEGSG